MAILQVDMELQWPVTQKLVTSTDLLWTISAIPPDEAILAIEQSGTRVVRYCEIYEQDGVTPWRTREQVDVIDGSVNYTWDRDERRICNVVLGNTEGDLVIKPGELWYDKVIKLFRGTNYTSSGMTQEEYLVPLGEYVLDEITYGHFPHTINLKGRDYTKKLLLSEFLTPTKFLAGTPIEDVIRAIAIGAGINPDKMEIPYPTGISLTKSHTFMSPTTRYKAIRRIVDAKGWEVHFSNNGYFVMAEQIDFTTLDSYEAYFSDGWNRDLYIGDTVSPNMTQFQRTRRDTRIRNIIIVVGEGANGPLVSGVAENHVVGSPTSVEELGERIQRITSQFLANDAAAEAYAERVLRVSALEEFEVTLQGIVYPWLDAGMIVRFSTKESVEGEPISYFVSNLTIPLTLAPMQVNLKRIVNVI